MSQRVGHSQCLGTPYFVAALQWRGYANKTDIYFIAAAKRELAFLKRLRPTSEKPNKRGVK